MNKLLTYLPSISLLIILLILPINSLAQERVASDQFNEIEKRAIEEIVRDYIIEHPEVLLESISLMEQRQQELRQAQAEKAIRENADEIFNAPTSFVGGNVDGNITIVEFFDYNCGYCKQGFPGMMNIINTDKNIRLVLKEYPVLGPESIVAARAAIASRKQNKYMAFHTALMKAKGKLSEQRIFDIAKDTGINIKKLKDDMQSPEVDATIERNHALTELLGIDGTPGYVIGNILVPGFIPEEGLKAVVFQARANKETVTN